MANELKELIEKRAGFMLEIDQENARHVDTMDIIRPLLLSVLTDIADYVEEGAPSPAPKKRTKPNKTRKPNHDATVKRYTDFEPTYGGCLCGCAETMDEGATFRPGHQNQLRSIAKAVDAGRLPRNKLTALGEAHAITAGWLKPVTEPEDAYHSSDSIARLAGYYAGKEMPLNMVLETCLDSNAKLATPLGHDDVIDIVRTVFDEATD
jgi:hypothetical protein